MTPDGCATVLVRNETTAGAWTFDGRQWVEKPALLNGLELDGKPIYTSLKNRNRGVRLRAIEHEGVCNLIVGNESQNAVFSWSAEERRWKQLPWALPPETSIVDAEGNDNGLRFVDINGDGFDDVIFARRRVVRQPSALGWVSKHPVLGTRQTPAAQKKVNYPAKVLLVIVMGHSQGQVFVQRQSVEMVPNKRTAAAAFPHE